MSLESGAKLGYSGSLIYLLLPVIGLVSLMALIVALFANPSAVPTYISSWVFGGFFILLIVAGVIGIVGFILFMVAMYRLSNYYREPAIFKNILYGFILSIVSAVVVLVLEFANMLFSFAQLSQAGTSPVTTSFSQIIIEYLVVIAVAIVFALVTGWLYMGAFNKLKQNSGIDNFGTAGLLFLIGAIIPFVTWIAWIFAAMGFHKLKTPAPISPTPFISPPAPQPNSMPMKRCPHCGKENRTEALFCSNCGKPLQ